MSKYLIRYKPINCLKAVPFTGELIQTCVSYVTVRGTMKLCV